MASDKVHPLETTGVLIKKNLGKDSSPAKLTAHDKLDAIQQTANETLNDTADIQPRLETVEGKVDTVQSSINTVDSVVDANAAALSDSSTGLAAIKAGVDQAISEVDALEENLGTPSSGTVASHVEAIENNLGQTSNGTVASHVEAIENTIGTPANGTVAAEFAQLDAKLGQIQNNTRTVIVLNNEFELPAAGQTRYFKITLANYDTNNDMQVPDSDPTLSVEDALGVDKSGNLGSWDGSTFSAGTTMDAVAGKPGVYEIFYRLQSTQPPNVQLNFIFSIIEAAKERLIPRTSMIVEEISSTFTAADRLTANDSNTKITDIQNKIGAPATTLADALAAIKAQTNSTEGKVDIIDSLIDNIKDTVLQEMRQTAGGSFNRETMSLEAIVNLLTQVSTEARLSIWDAIKTSGSIAAGGSETVVLTNIEGVMSEIGTLNFFEVNPTTSCDDYSVQICEDAAGNKVIAEIEEWDSVEDGRCFISPKVDYKNLEGEKKLYVKITNNSSIAASFSAHLRGKVGFAA